MFGGLGRFGVLGAASTGEKPLPVIDYILWLGSSTPYETSQVNTVLGRQEQPLRAKFCAAGIDVPVIPRAVAGRRISDQDTGMAADIAYMGNAVANGKKVGVLVNIGSNDIITTDYDDMPPATRDAMLAGLNSIIDKIEGAGMLPLIAVPHSRQGYSAIYEEWADKMFRPLIASRCPQWFKSGLGVFDYCRLYTDNVGTANWFQGDGIHPNAATPVYQEYSATQLKAAAKCKAAPAKERYIFGWPTAADYVGGINQMVGAVSGTFAAGTVRDTKGVINASATLSWSNAQASLASRGNSGAWDVDLTNHRLQMTNLYKTGGTITLTAGFGAGYAGRTGTLRVTANSSSTPRLTKFTVGAQSTIINASTGIQIGSIPFALDGSGNMTITAAPEAPSTIANVSGLEIEFD